MELKSVGEVVARRDLYILNDEEPNQDVVVLIGKPQSIPDLRDFYCPYQILGAGESKVRYAGGVDAVQAIQLALKAIETDLATLNEKCGRKLRWLSGEVPGLGFSAG